MTYEGRIAGIYHDNMIVIFHQLYPEFNFTGRKNKSNSRNYNASDEINTLLNYGYAILESEIRKAINRGQNKKYDTKCYSKLYFLAIIV